MSRIRVRRERPSALAWALALCVTMLAVYGLTLDAAAPRAAEAAPGGARVTRQIELEGLEGWCVSLAQCASAEETRVRASELVERGAAGCVRLLEGAWQVLGAVYDTEREARRVLERLLEEGLPARLMRLEAQGLRLRVTGAQAQIDAILRADELIREQTRQLGQMALQLDRDELSADAARALCALAASEAGGALEDLQAIPGGAENRLCAELIRRLSQLRELEVTLSRLSAPTAALSGQLRCAQLEAFLNQLELLAQSSPDP